MKGKIVRRIFSLSCATIFVLLLTGCNPTAGATEYEVIYPSGYSRDSYAYDEKSPIEGSSCYLQWEKADDYEKTYDYDIHILDENDSVLYRYPDVGSKAMRGSIQEDGKTWVCAEHWTAPHHIWNTMLFLSSWKRRKREAVWIDKDTSGKCGNLLPGYFGLDTETYGLHF